MNFRIFGFVKMVSFALYSKLSLVSAPIGGYFRVGKVTYIAVELKNMFPKERSKNYLKIFHSAQLIKTFSLRCIFLCN